MSGPNIKISVQLGYYPDQRDKHLVIPLDWTWTKEAAQPIDYPRPGSDPFVRMLCTSQDDIRKRRYDRAAIRNAAMDAVGEAITKLFDANDTENGYKREQPSSAVGEQK